MDILHLVVTDAFAGTERYVCDVASRQSLAGHSVTVIGGEGGRMTEHLDPAVTWLPGATVSASLRSAVGRHAPSIVHAHLTAAETVGLVLRLRWRSTRFVSTRHIAAVRGSRRAGKLIAPLIRRSVDRQLAISDFVAARVDGPSSVLHNGVASQPLQAPLDASVVLLCQRLELEKDTATALQAWKYSKLAEQGWTMRIAGQGAESASLEALAGSLGIADSVTFLGSISNVPHEMLRAGVFVATATEEPLGLSVLEAMSFGLPVIAGGSGGHLETVGAVSREWLFPAGDSLALAALLRRASEMPGEVRSYGERLRDLQRTSFDLDDHVERLLKEYEAA